MKTPKKQRKTPVRVSLGRKLTNIQRLRGWSDGEIAARLGIREARYREFKDDEALPRMETMSHMVARLQIVGENMELSWAAAHRRLHSGTSPQTDLSREWDQGDVADDFVQRATYRLFTKRFAYGYPFGIRPSLSLLREALDSYLKCIEKIPSSILHFEKPTEPPVPADYFLNQSPCQ